jgi:hypothetical protein
MKRNRPILAGVIAAASLSSPALALDAKQCLPMAELNALLRAEGQRTLVIGNREALNNAPERASGVKITRYADAVTSNADGSLGYQLEGDLPRDQISTSMCVGAKLTNVRLFDARKAGLNRAALLGGAFDEQARALETVGTRPMVIADTVHRNDDGSERLGLPMIIFGNMSNRSASIYARQADGKPAFMVLMGDTDYTAEALRRLGG